MPLKEDIIRNKRTFYPAPKPAINREAFRNAYMTLKTAEKRLCQDSAFAQSMPTTAETSEGQQAQSLRHGYREHQGADRDGGDEEMKGLEVRDADVQPFSQPLRGQSISLLMLSRRKREITAQPSEKLRQG